MSADKIIIEPDEFGKQKEEYRKASGDTASIQISTECDDICLHSVARFHDCINLLNRTFDTLSTLLEYDCAALDGILEDWKNLDAKQAAFIANLLGPRNNENGGGSF